MKKRGGSGALLLSELLITLLIFALGAAVCLSVFAAARNEAGRSEMLSRAVLEAANAAECFQAAGGSLSGAASRLGGTLRDGTVEVRFDSQWAVAERGVYRLTLSSAGADARGLAAGEIIVYNEESVLYQLHTAALAPEAAA